MFLSKSVLKEFVRKFPDGNLEYALTFARLNLRYLALPRRCPLRSSPSRLRRWLGSRQRMRTGCGRWA